MKIVRTHSAGVFAGEIESRNGQEVVMRNARRLWYWDGASSLSELAVRGVSKPQNCKFPVAVDRVELLQAIEILDCTPEAEKSINEVPEWTQRSGFGYGFGDGYGYGDGSGYGSGD